MIPGSCGLCRKPFAAIGANGAAACLVCAGDVLAIRDHAGRETQMHNHWGLTGGGVFVVGQGGSREEVIPPRKGHVVAGAMLALGLFVLLLIALVEWITGETIPLVAMVLVAVTFASMAIGVYVWVRVRNEILLVDAARGGCFLEHRRGRLLFVPFSAIRSIGLFVIALPSYGDRFDVRFELGPYALRIAQVDTLEEAAPIARRLAAATGASLQDIRRESPHG